MRSAAAGLGFGVVPRGIGDPAGGLWSGQRGGVFLYWSDKRKAATARWRTPENVLHAVELAGGWPGALIAQQVFRHKTRKVSYQVLFWVIVLLHQVFWVDKLFLGGTLLSLL
ncbi:MAG: hypothetical protein GAK32_01695 [Pseudomonas fluorescens]|nr:MAG: hypothetical protein GAK32_01695 [Pseudomonas fluorescens]